MGFVVDCHGIARAVQPREQEIFDRYIREGKREERPAGCLRKAGAGGRGSVELLSIHEQGNYIASEMAGEARPERMEVAAAQAADEP